MAYSYTSAGAERATRRRRTNMPSAPIMGKLQPQAIDMEQAVLGAILVEKDAYSIVTDMLQPESFYERKHQIIYEAVQKLAINQEPIDILTVTNKLETMGKIEEVGGAVYVASLTQHISSAAHLEYHAKIVAQKSKARQLISYASSIEEQAFDETVDISELLNRAEGQLFELQKSSIKKDVETIDGLINVALEKIEQASNRKEGLSGLPTGFTELDKMTSGWQNTDLIIIAARPAMGKTAFVLSMCKNMAVNYNIPVAVFSLEMSNLQLVNRLVQNECEISGDKIKSGRLTPEEWIQLNSRVQALRNAPIFVDDTPSLSVFELQTKARRLVAERHVQMIMIDYLQLMNATGMQYGSREQEVSTISRSLKGLAKELNIPIIALSQLNRSVESRGAVSGSANDAKRPQLSDLRESGAIEQDADMVCFIHRPEYYKIYEDEKGNSLKGLAQIIIAKHRNGSVGDVNLRFRGEFVRFENIDDYRSINPTMTQWAAPTAAPDVTEFTSRMDSAPSAPDALGTDNSVPF